MHKSLTLRNNLTLIFVWASVMITFAFSAAHPNKVLMIAVGSICGAVAGILQLRAIQESKDRFLSATTELDVRAAMTSSRSGRFAIYVLYTAGVILLLTAFSLKDGVGFGLIAGYAAFAFIRDCITIKGCIILRRASEAK